MEQQQTNSTKSYNIPLMFTVQSKGLLKKHKEPDGWDAVLLKATLAPLPEFNADAFVWGPLKNAGAVFWTDHGHHKHLAGQVDHVEIKKDGTADLSLYLDLQQESAQELYKALVEQQPLQFSMPGKAQFDDVGNVTKATSGRLVLAPVGDGDRKGSPALNLLRYDTPLDVRQNLAELAEQMTAEKWAQELGLETPDDPAKVQLKKPEVQA